MMNKNGFTIIEILIVLALAGLIALIVFLAVPAAKRNSRNHQRRADATQILGAIKEATKLSNSNSLPLSCNNSAVRPRHRDCFLHGVNFNYYQNDDPNVKTASYHKRDDPWGEGDMEHESNIDPTNHSVQTDYQGTNFVDSEFINVRTYTKCNDDGTYTGVDADERDVAIQFAIETVGDNILMCIEGSI